MTRSLVVRGRESLWPMRIQVCTVGWFHPDTGPHLVGPAGCHLPRGSKGLEERRHRLQTPPWVESLCWRCEWVILPGPAHQGSRPAAPHCESVERGGALPGSPASWGALVGNGDEEWEGRPSLGRVTVEPLRCPLSYTTVPQTLQKCVFVCVCVGGKMKRKIPDS